MKRLFGRRNVRKWAFCGGFACIMAIAVPMLPGIPATGAETIALGAGTLVPQTTVPMQNAELTAAENFKQFSIIFPGGGDDGISKLWRSGRYITLEKDGVVVQEVDCTDMNALTYDSRNPGGILINVAPLKEAGSYVLTIPAGLVEMAQDMTGVGGDGAAAPTTEQLTNAKYTIKFTVVETPEFTLYPAPGRWKPSEMGTFTLTFPEGAVVELQQNPLVPASFRNFQPVVIDADSKQVSYNVSTLISNLSAKAEGNKLVLTANTTIPPLTQSIYSEWDYLVVPRGLYTVTVDGRTYDMPALKFEKYDVRSGDVLTLNIQPTPESKESFTPGELQDIAIYWPEGYTPNPMSAVVGKTAGYLKQATSADALNGFMAGAYVIKSINAADRTMLLSLGTPASDEAYYNNPERLESSWYTVAINTGLFKNGTANSQAVNIPGYNVKGAECFYPTAIYPYGKDGKVTSSPIVDVAVGFSKVQLQFPFPLEATGALNATLWLGGEKLAEASSVSISAADPKWVDVEFPATYKNEGMYTVKMEAGQLRQTQCGNYTNGAINQFLEMPDPAPYAFTPGGGEHYYAITSGNNKKTGPVILDNVREITVVYPENITAVVSNFPNLNSVSLQVVNASNGSVPMTTPNTFHPISIKGDGNKVHLTFGPETDMATGTNFCYKLNVEHGAWRTLNADGVNSVNAAQYAYYGITKVEKGNVVTASGVQPGGEASVEELKSLFYVPTLQPIGGINEYLSPPYLRKKLVAGATEEKLLEYSPKVEAEDGDKAVMLTGGKVRMLCTSILAVPEGEVEFVIPASSCLNLLYSGTSRSEVWVYPFIVKGSTVAPEDPEKPEEPAKVPGLHVMLPGGALVLQHTVPVKVTAIPEDDFVINGAFHNDADIVARLSGSEAYEIQPTQDAETLNVVFGDKLSTAVGEVYDNVRVFAHGGEIFVTGLTEGAQVVLCSVDGQVVKSLIATGDVLAFTTSYRGVAILVAGGKVYKLVLN